MTADSTVVNALVARLTNLAHSEPAAGFPADRTASGYPGLYSWWADDNALDILSAPFGIRLPPLIYAGQTGATSTRSRRARLATLGSRICTNHLNGNVASSTFRKTLTAVLFEPLSLKLSGPQCLDKTSNAAVSGWMRAHLCLVIAPHPDRERLAEVEHAVLQRIDPPLNLMGMPPTPIRATLSGLRRRLDCPITLSVGRKN